MRLLFDQNLSPRLIDLLSDSYPESVHVQSAGLDRASDEAVWNYAMQHGLIIVTKEGLINSIFVIPAKAGIHRFQIPGCPPTRA